MFSIYFAGENVFECEICQEKFYTKFHKRKHMKTVHPPDPKISKKKRRYNYIQKINMVPVSQN